MNGERNHADGENHHDGTPSLRRLIIIAIALAITGVAPAVSQQLGRISYIEGDVELVRDGAVREGYEIGIGEPVLELDVIQTGYDGYVEIELDQPPNSAVRVQENSAYYVELMTDEDGTETTRLKLLNGTVEVAVDRVSRDSRLNVETRSVVFGVRGTEFDVITAPDEAALLGVREGQVAVATDNEQRVANAGSVVESVPDEALSEESVDDGDFESYYQRWTEIRLQIFRNGATTFVRAYARRYLDSVDTFQRAYRELITYRPRLEEAVEREGNALGDDMRLRQQISPSLIAMRSILPIFENTVYRLRELQRFHDQGIGVTEIDGRSSQAFFREFGRESSRIIGQLSEVRTMFRLYREIEERSFGGLPGGGSPFDGGSPFGNNGSDILNSMQF